MFKFIITIIIAVLSTGIASANSIDDMMKARYSGCEGAHFIYKTVDKNAIPNVTVADNVAAIYIINEFGWGKYFRMCVNNQGKDRARHEQSVLDTIIKDKSIVSPKTLKILKEIVHIHAGTLTQKYRGKGTLPLILYQEMFTSKIDKQLALIEVTKDDLLLKSPKFDSIFELSKHDKRVQYMLSSWLYRQQKSFTPVIGGDSPLPIYFDDYSAEHDNVEVSPVLNHEMVMITSKTGELSNEEIVDLFEAVLNKFPANSLSVTKSRITVFYNKKMEE